MSPDAPDTTHLSDAELHDVVVITTAINEAEALYLMTRLEDSGIPVLRTADAINYHNPIKTPEIRVPRTLVARAQEIIDTARAEAKARALENAFDFDEVDEKDAKQYLPKFRLLTCVMGMVVTGLLIGANIRLDYSFGNSDDLEAGRADFQVDRPAKSMVRELGWPFQFYKVDYPGEVYYYPIAFCADILVLIAVLAVTTVGTEWWLRRR